MELAEIFVELLEEGVDCWRPVAAQRLDANRFRIVGSVPEEEVWQFKPGDTVRCAERAFSDGSRGLVAVRNLTPNPRVQRTPLRAQLSPEAVRRRMTKRAWVFLALSAISASELLAKRTTDYVPPPDLERLVRGFVALAPLSAVLAGLSLLALRKFNLAKPRGQRRRFLVGAFVLTLTGAAVAAALDRLNDELWEPAFWGSPFLAAIPVLGLLCLAP